MMLHRIPANSKLIPSQGVGFKMPSKMPEVDKSESQELKGELTTREFNLKAVNIQALFMNIDRGEKC